jgi:formylglycine-generating enzyme required for sulfatase activity
MAENERKFFNQTPIWQQLIKGKQASCDILLDQLNEGYRKYLKDYWAFDTIEKLKEKRKEIEAEILAHGPTFTPNEIKLFGKLFDIAFTNILENFRESQYQLLFDRLSKMNIKNIFTNKGFKEKNNDLWMGKKEFSQMLAKGKNDIFDEIINQYMILAVSIFDQYAKDFNRILKEDRFKQKTVSELKLGRFENFVQFLIDHCVAECDRVEGLVMSQVEDIINDWIIHAMISSKDEVIFRDVDALGYQMMSWFLLRIKSIHFFKGWSELQGQDIVAFMKDFSLDERLMLEGKIKRLDQALSDMGKIFGKVEGKKVNVKVKYEGDRVVKGVGFKMVYCPEGEFWMGTDDASLPDSLWNRSKPKHKIKITKGFWMGETQVTQELWNAVMGWNSSKFKGSMKLPIEMISWYDCLVFCNKISELEGFNVSYVLSNIQMDGQHITYAQVEWKKDVNGYRLATEAEWEYSAKAGTELIYSGSNNIDEAAWYNGNLGIKTHEVKSKKPNAWGLYDMSGNVWEWCHDAFDENIYKNRATNENPVNWNNAHCARVLRGGSYWNDAINCRMVYRGGNDADRQRDSWGLRLFRCESPKK